MSDTEILLTIVTPLAIGLSLGRYVESLRWQDGYWSGKPVRSGGIDWRVMQERIYQHLLAEREPAGDAGCCREEKPIQYRSHDQE